MAQILARLGTRCQDHPHRRCGDRCDRCGQPFCPECLTPAERKADGTRDWFCGRCLALMDEHSRRRVREAALAYRAARAAARARATGVALAAAGFLLAAGGAGSFVLARTFGTGAEQALPERAASCGELTRIRSIGAIGTQAGDDAVNVLAYPQRAAVRLVPAGVPTGQPDGPASPGGQPGGQPPGALPPTERTTALQAPVDARGDAPGDEATGAQAVVDECNTGWRRELDEGSPLLPATLVLDTGRQGSYIQRIALWQDPQAPRDAWVLDFEVLASTTEAGDDFVPVMLDRPARLRETVEPQWFEVVRPAPGNLAPPFPDIVEMRRLQLRILSTRGSSADSRRAGQPPRPVERVALGEVAAYGPDVEVLVDHPGKIRSAFTFKPAVISARAGQPKFVLFLNQTTTAEPHLIVSVGQERNLEVRLGPNEARSGLFVAGRPGVYEFACRQPGHAQLGLTGTITVR